MSEAPKEFQPIGSRDEALKLLREGAKSFASVLLWTKNQATLVRTHLSLFSEKDRLLYFHKPEEVELKKFLAEAEAAGSDCFFSVSLAYANIFFKSKFAGMDKAGFRFHLPEQVFKVQRRKDLRFRIPEGHVLKVEFANPLNTEERVTRKVFDLSAGGLSFLTVAADEAVYVNGLMLKNITFTVASRIISVDAEVRHRKNVDTQKKGEIKVGILFKNLRAADSQLIASYTFEESRRYFLRFM